MINLINVEEPLQNALETIGRYCKHNDCKTCSLKINDDICLTDKDPDIWWMYLNTDHKTKPQEDYKKWDVPPKVEIPTVITTCVSMLASAFEDEPQLITKCLNCANSGSYKCSRCDGEMYFKDEPQTERHLPDYSYEADLGRRIMEQMERSE